MGIDSRLNKLLPSLTARERAVLAMRAQRLGHDPAEARGTVPQEQRLEYNRFMALAFVAGCQLRSLLFVLKVQVENFEFNLGRIDLIERAATILEEDHPDDVAARPVRPWRQRVKASEAVTVPEFLRCLAAEVREDCFKELSFRWQELRSVETVLAEISESFDGESLLDSEATDWLRVTRESAVSYQERLGRKRLPEPDEAHLQHVQDLIDHGVAALSLTEE